MSRFQQARKSQARLRLALTGLSGGGKTFSALRIARGIGGPDARIALIDTEHGSASKYAVPSFRADRPQEGEFRFDTIQLDHFSPQNYIDLIEAAGAEKYDVLIIDSLSHAWIGRGGELEMVDRATKRSKSGNSYTGRREVTPLHNALIDAIIRSDCHVIATMRSKTDVVLQPDSSTGKLVPRKVGLAPVQREGMDYEFDVVGDLDLDNNLVIGKTRFPALAGQVIPRPTEALGQMLSRWLSDAEPVAQEATQAPPEAPQDVQEPPPAAVEPTPPPTTSLGGAGRPAAQEGRMRPSDRGQHMRIMALVSDLGMSHDDFRKMLSRRGAETIADLSAEDAQMIIVRLIRVYEQHHSAGPIVESIKAAESAPGEEKEKVFSDVDTPEDHLVPDVNRREASERKAKARAKDQAAPEEAMEGVADEATDEADQDVIAEANINVIDALAN